MKLRTRQLQAARRRAARPTPQLTPTRRGFQVLHRRLVSVRDLKGGAYTLDLKVRTKLAPGVKLPPGMKMVRGKAEVTIRGLAVPLDKTVRRKRRKGESMQAARRRLIEQRVGREINQAVLGIHQRYPRFSSLVRALGYRKALKKLGGIKQQRGATFKVRVNRVRDIYAKPLEQETD